MEARIVGVGARASDPLLGPKKLCVSWAVQLWAYLFIWRPTRQRGVKRKSYRSAKKRRTPSRARLISRFRSVFSGTREGSVSVRPPRRVGSPHIPATAYGYGVERHSPARLDYARGGGRREISCSSEQANQPARWKTCFATRRMTASRALLSTTYPVELLMSYYLVSWPGKATGQVTYGTGWDGGK